MKIKLTESQLKKVLKEVGGYDSSEVMATHAGPLHTVISSQTMELLMLVSKLAQGISNEELNRTELVNGIYNLNQKISEYIKQMPDFVKEIYIDDDFKIILKSFISALVKINKYFRMLVGSGQDQSGTFYTGLSFDMTQDELGLKVAEQISTLTDQIQELGMMIMTIHQRFNDRTSRMNENTLNEQFDEKGYKYKGDPDPVTGEPKVLYNYDVIATMEDKNGKLFDIVKYYFLIKDYSYVNDYKREKSMGTKIQDLFDNRKKKLIQKLELKCDDCEEFKPNKINGWFPAEKGGKMIMTPQQEDMFDEFIAKGDWKKVKKKDKRVFFDSGTHQRRTEKSMLLEITYIVEHDWHFNVGRIYR